MNDYTYQFNEDCFRMFGRIRLQDLKELAHNFPETEITIKSLKGEVKLSLASTVRKYRNIWPYCLELNLYSYTVNGETHFTRKFSEIGKIIREVVGKGFSMVKIEEEIVELSDGDLAINDDSICFCYDTEEYNRKKDCYFCQTDNEWYENDDNLVYADGDYYDEDDDDVFWCERCEEYHTGDYYDVHVSSSGTETWCSDCYYDHGFCCDDCGEYWTNDEEYHIDWPDQNVCRSCYDENYYYCEECDCTVSSNHWDYDNECCEECSGKNSAKVKSYHWHHCNDYENKYSLFMTKGRTVRLGNSNETRTIGLELEVSKNTTSGQDETINKLLELPLEENEIFFEHDGSLDCGGFEIITGVHTFDSIKTMPWKEILEILKENGYRSHNGGLCGLHVHIGRKFFGKTDDEQSHAIGNIYAFFALFWNDIVKASRRESFTYCDHPFVNFSSSELEKKSKAKDKLFMKAKSKEGNHGLALNNYNDNTFEIRLGRGTLVYESFMAWVDFTITIARNSKRIAIKNLKDCDKWLDGISYETAVYLKSRNAFSDSVVIKNLTNEGVSVCA